MKIIIANWKMNGNRKLLDKNLLELGKIHTKNRVVLCVPYTLLRCGDKNADFGAQNISGAESGAFSGQISADMVAETGAKYTIVGHSEVRKFMHLKNSDVLMAAENAINAGLTPIICIGESATEHRTGRTNSVIKSQLRECVPQTGRVIIAYEPRWVIGAGKIPQISEIARVHNLIRAELTKMGKNCAIVYGGSVNASNATEIMSSPNVDGVLVGGASLKTSEFITIISCAN